MDTKIVQSECRGGYKLASLRTQLATSFFSFYIYSLSAKVSIKLKNNGMIGLVVKLAVAIG
jgi:hypothetical protein